MITLTLPYPPSTNRYWRIYRGRAVKSAEAKLYTQAVGWLARAAKVAPLTGDLRITLRVYRPAKRGDLDNTAKVLLDALQGFCYDNDSQIVELHMYRCDDKTNPRVEVEVTHG